MKIDSSGNVATFHVPDDGVVELAKTLRQIEDVARQEGCVLVDDPKVINYPDGGRTFCVGYRYVPASE